MLDAVPIGLRTAAGELLLNPNPDRVVAAGDEVLVLAEDDDTYRVIDLDPSLVPSSAPGPEYHRPPPLPERILMTGGAASDSPTAL